MKKLAVILMVLAIPAAGLFADRVIPVEKLPQQAKDFISTNFSGKTATYVEADYNEYEVTLNDGTEISFSGKGEWKEVKSYTGVPAAVLSSSITNQVTQNYPDAIIIEAEKNWNGIELKLSNRMEMYFDNSGKLIGQKFDD